MRIYISTFGNEDVDRKLLAPPAVVQFEGREGIFLVLGPPVSILISAALGSVFKGKEPRTMAVGCITHFAHLLVPLTNNCRCHIDS